MLELYILNSLKLNYNPLIMPKYALFEILVDKYTSKSLNEQLLQNGYSSSSLKRKP